MKLPVALIRGFVENSGGLDKCRGLRDSLKNVAPDKRGDYVRQVAEMQAGAEQLFAMALLGLAVAVEVYEQTQKEVD